MLRSISSVSAVFVAATQTVTVLLATARYELSAGMLDWSVILCCMLSLFGDSKVVWLLPMDANVLGELDGSYVLQ